MSNEPELVLSKLTRRFVEGGRGHNAPAALSQLDLSVNRGELLVLIGPSGCGKSTTLRLIAGLDEADGGDIHLAGRSMKGVPPQDRDVAMVFQGYALYPHMTAREVMEFPLKMRKVSPIDRKKAVDEAADMLGLTRLLDRRPDQMSGGERQRVAMGRAIVRKPRVFLFDEPLSNLDAALRAELRVELGALVRRLGATALYVTHDHVEAMTLGDRIAVLRAGELLQLGPPREIYETPANKFIATFVGSPPMNVFAATSVDRKVEAGTLSWAVSRSLPRELEVGVRPEHVFLEKEGESGARAEVISVEPLGAESHVLVNAGNVPLRARVPGFATFRRGDTVRVSIDVAALHFFDPTQDGARLS